MYYLSILRDLDDEKLLCLITTFYPTFPTLGFRHSQLSSHPVLTFAKDRHNVDIKVASWPL
jgi:hypothetical protein